MYKILVSTIRESQHRGEGAEGGGGGWGVAGTIFTTFLEPYPF